MAEVAAYESWVGTEVSIGTEQLGSIWDICKLGEVFLPGVVTIEDFEYGQDVDVQKRKKKEKARLRDNGLSPVTFNIRIELTAARWHEWLTVLPSIQPRRAGALREPLAIEHPLPNAHGVQEIYIHKIKVDAPSARKGMTIILRVGEWFEEEKEADGAKKGAVANNKPAPKAISDATGAVGRGLRRWTEEALKFQPGALDDENTQNNLFGGP